MIEAAITPLPSIKARDIEGIKKSQRTNMLMSSPARVTNVTPTAMLNSASSVSTI
jgi:hypothetical protein